MKTCRSLMLVLCFAGCAGTSFAAGAPGLGPVPVPAEFKTESARTTVPVAFARGSGESFNPIDKPSIEAQCEMARKLGKTVKLPVFEAGHDKPVKTESLRFSNASQLAHLTTVHEYLCVRPEGRSSSADALCDCTYRVRPRQRAEIRNVRADGVETLSVDLLNGTAERRVRPAGPADDPERQAAKVNALAPTVVGREVIAGIPCVVRRQSLGGSSHVDRCIVEDPERRLPPALRSQALSETVPSPDGKGLYRWTRTDEVATDASVDAGVFMLPRGISVKDKP